MIYIFGGNGVLNSVWGTGIFFLVFSKKAFYHLSHASPLFTLVVFQIVSHNFCLG
jgi:hypothetical protein